MSEPAAAIRMMMETPAWKTVEDIIEQIKRESVVDQDRVPTQDLNVAILAECRGVRKGLSILMRRIEEKSERRTM